MWFEIPALSIIHALNPESFTGFCRAPRGEKRVSAPIGLIIFVTSSEG